LVLAKDIGLVTQWPSHLSRYKHCCTTFILWTNCLVPSPNLSCGYYYLAT